MSIKSMINEKSTMVLPNMKSVTVTIDEALRGRIKEFWKNSSLEEQLQMFHENNTLKSVSKCMRAFGELYNQAKRNPGSLTAIERGIMEKTYFASEKLPGFENKVNITQLFCNGRDSKGAYRIHQFYFLLPTSEFELVADEHCEIKIAEYLKEYCIDNFQNPIRFCLGILKRDYADIALKQFKKGVFIGDYNPDNIWSAWRYMNCREFTLNQTQVIPRNMYDAFEEKATEFSDTFFDRMSKSLLSELWKTNIRIAIFSTLFENNILLTFFMKNPSLSAKYKLVERGIIGEGQKHSSDSSGKRPRSRAGYQDVQTQPIIVDTAGPGNSRVFEEMTSFLSNSSLLHGCCNPGNFDIPSLKKFKFMPGFGAFGSQATSAFGYSPLATRGDQMPDFCGQEQLANFFGILTSQFTQGLTIPQCFNLENEATILCLEPSGPLASKVSSACPDPKLVKYLRRRQIVSSRWPVLERRGGYVHDEDILVAFDRWRHKSTRSSTTKINSGKQNQGSFSSLSKEESDKGHGSLSQKGVNKPYSETHLKSVTESTNKYCNFSSRITHKSQSEDFAGKKDPQLLFRYLLKRGLVKRTRFETLGKLFNSQSKIDLESIPPRFRMQK